MKLSDINETVFQALTPEVQQKLLLSSWGIFERYRTDPTKRKLPGYGDGDMWIASLNGNQYFLDSNTLCRTLSIVYGSKETMKKIYDALNNSEITL